MSRVPVAFAALALTCCGGSGESGPKAPRNFWDVCDLKPACECGAACDGKPVQVVTGQGHTCIRYDSGGVMCWGLSRGTPEDPSVFRGDLGPVFDPGVGNRYAARPPEGIRDALQLTAGEWHTCALRKDGTAWCWGRNDNGQLGIDEPLDSRVEHKTPASVPDLSRVTTIDAGGNGTCAVRAPHEFLTIDGGLWPNGEVPSIRCANGQGTLCQLTTEGTVYCWGFNEWGELGNGMTSEDSAGSYHIPATILSDVTDLDSGIDSSCAIRKNGELWCWGSNNDGQIGIGMVSSTAEPPQKVEGFDGAIVNIDIGDWSVCAIREDGQLFCWGEDFTQLTGPHDVFEDVPSPVAIEGASDVIDVAVNGDHGCIIRRSGQVACWGSDIFGATGPERRYLSASPFQVVRGLPGIGQTPYVEDHPFVEGEE